MIVAGVMGVAERGLRGEGLVTSVRGELQCMACLAY